MELEQILLRLDRIKKSIKNKNFLKRIFCKDEISKCNKLKKFK